MAVATIVSRATGFGRIAAFGAVLGLGGLRQAFDVANVLPNVVYELLLGGILSATLVPLLVAARARGSDAALAYAQRLLSLVLLGLVLVSVAAVVLAPWLVGLYTRSHDPDEVALTVAWARWFLPQILFYGLSATIGAVLNAQARFAAAMWAPVLNNVVVIATLALFLLVPGPEHPAPGSLSRAQFLTLAIGTTAGVVAMALVLLPALRSSGFRWRLRLDVRGMGLRAVAQMAAWTLLYVAAIQAGVWVQTRLATSAGVLPTYTSAFTVWQLPHAIIAVSLITALLPRMSAHAAGGDVVRLRADLERGVRVCLLALMPLAVIFAVCGRDVAVVLFAHGATSADQAQRVGWVLALLAVGLVPFSVYQLQARAFYAQRDTRTPALVQCAVSVVLIGAQVGLSALLPATGRGYALAGGYACAYVVGVVVSAVALRRRIARSAVPEASAPTSSPTFQPPSGSASGVRVDGALLVRLLPAAVACAGAAVALNLALDGVGVGEPGTGWGGALARGGVAGAVGLLMYAAVLWLLNVPEVRTFRQDGRR